MCPSIDEKLFWRADPLSESMLWGFLLFVCWIDSFPVKNPASEFINALSIALIT